MGGSWGFDVAVWFSSVFPWGRGSGTCKDAHNPAGPQNRNILLIEMAVTVDGGRPFRTSNVQVGGRWTTCFVVLRGARDLATGDSCVPLSQYQCYHTGDYKCFSPSCCTVVEELRMKMHTAYYYFLSRYHGQLQSSVSAFKAARLLCPPKARDLQPDATTVDTLSVFPFLQDKETLEDWAFCLSCTWNRYEHSLRCLPGLVEATFVTATFLVWGHSPSCPCPAIISWSREFFSS